MLIKKKTLLPSTMKVFTSQLFITLAFFFSCSIESEKINYGKESCHFCTMTIVDKQHASEVVTTKGKVFKYDAIECMINDLKQKKDLEIGLLFVNDYANPGVLIDAKPATYLISEKIKSPMGAFLSAFGSNDEAQEALEEYGGKLYNWDSIQKQINN